MPVIHPVLCQSGDRAVRLCGIRLQQVLNQRWLPGLPEVEVKVLDVVRILQSIERIQFQTQLPVSVVDQGLVFLSSSKIMARRSSAVPWNSCSFCSSSGVSSGDAFSFSLKAFVG